MTADSAPVRKHFFRDDGGRAFATVVTVLQIEGGEALYVFADLLDKRIEDHFLVDVVKHRLRRTRHDLGDELLPNANLGVKST